MMTIGLRLKWKSASQLLSFLIIKKYGPAGLSVASANRDEGSIMKRQDIQEVGHLRGWRINWKHSNSSTPLILPPPESIPEKKQ